MGEQAVAPRFFERDGNIMVSNAGVKPVVSDEVIHSPEQISSITACSDGEPYENGSTFSKGILKCI